MLSIDTPLQAACYFFVYSFLGWGVEVAFHAITLGKLVNRGFLNGPVCPIYGFGMLAMLALLAPVQNHLILLFLGGMAITTLVELVGGWALYKLFHTRWWDYSGFRCNLGGFICLQFSLYWGVGSVVMLKLIHPLVALAVQLTPHLLRVVLVWVFLGVFAVDVGVSAAIAVKLDRRLRELDEIRDSLRRSSDLLTEKIGVTAMTADELLDEQRLQLALAAAEGREDLEEWQQEFRGRVSALRQRRRELLGRLERMPRLGRWFGLQRLLEAFPSALRTQDHNAVLSLVRQELADSLAAQKLARAKQRLARRQQKDGRN